jgi:hypothetical protein
MHKNKWPRNLPNSVTEVVAGASEVAIGKDGALASIAVARFIVAIVLADPDLTILEIAWP